MSKVSHNGQPWKRARTDDSVYTSDNTWGDKTHEANSTYFIGPQSENLDYFKKNILLILDELQSTRAKYFPADGKFISESIQQTSTFKSCTKDVTEAIRTTCRLMGKHSIPFWSPRYQGHMCFDTSIPAMLGYFSAMLYNQNNVTLEASPLTTVAEIEVGQQLCKMFGYNTDPEKEEPCAWGHLPCDGSVANLESVWAARNLKFYPLSLALALQPNAELQNVGHTFKVTTCEGISKLFTELSTWEMLNLKPKTVLDLSDRLVKEHGVSPKYIETVMQKYTIQSTGKDALEKHYKIENAPVYMLSQTRHYSWPKAGAVAGIGSDNMIGIPVDYEARVDMAELEAKLEECLQKMQPVFAVVAIIGSTEEGSVDSLSSIVQIRKKYQARGLSFLIHADAAWGGYFTTMLPKDYHPGDILSLPTEVDVGDGYVPDLPLRAKTQEDLFALRYADSITVDPHKSAYVPYPAGGLCYRDGRMRFLITWTSPYLSRGATTEGIGIYGIEGSKPGAAAMATYLSNKCIGLDNNGYGALLSEVTFTCSRFSAEWAAMSTPEACFTVVPLNQLPSELRDGATADDVEIEKQRIRDEIIRKSNAEIVREDAHRPLDQKAMTLLRALGSDLNINAFGLNWKYSDGTLNDDVEEANYLMQRVIERLSVDSPDDVIADIPLFLTSTKFEPEHYGKCASHFKKRLGLRDDLNDLWVLRNVVMNPFPTEANFISKLAGILKRVIEEEVEVCRKRNENLDEYHNFHIQGIDGIYLVHYPNFFISNHRQQLIVEVDIPPEIKQEYVAIKKANTGDNLSLVTSNRIQLPRLLKEGSTFNGSILSAESGTIFKNVPVTLKRIVKCCPLNSRYRDHKYPHGHFPFYLYGTSDSLNIDHILTRAPNIQLSASGVKLTLDGRKVQSSQSRTSQTAQPTHPEPSRTSSGFKVGLGPLRLSASTSHPTSDKQSSSNSNLKSDTGSSTTTNFSEGGAILYVTNINEASMQPFPANTDLLKNPNFWFRPGAKLKVSVYKDTTGPEAQGPGLADAYMDEGNLIGNGELTLSEDVYVDSDGLNLDPYAKKEKLGKWRKRFESIGKSLES